MVHEAAKTSSHGGSKREVRAMEDIASTIVRSCVEFRRKLLEAAWRQHELRWCQLKEASLEEVMRTVRSCVRLGAHPFCERCPNCRELKEASRG